MIDRRGFMSSIIALGAAPAIVRADSLMHIVPHNIEVLIDQTILDVQRLSARGRAKTDLAKWYADRMDVFVYIITGEYK